MGEKRVFFISYDGGICVYRFVSLVINSYCHKTFKKIQIPILFVEYTILHSTKFHTFKYYNNDLISDQ